MNLLFKFLLYYALAFMSLLDLYNSISLFLYYAKLVVFHNV